MCGIGLHAWNMRSYFGLIINYSLVVQLLLYMYIHVPYGACILKAWQLTREYLHLTFNLEWLQVSNDSKSCWLRLTLSPFCGHKMDWEYCGPGWGANPSPQDGLTYSRFTLNYGLLNGGRHTWCTASPYRCYQFKYRGHDIWIGSIPKGWDWPDCAMIIIPSWSCL